MRIINLHCIRHGESIHNILYKKYGEKVLFDKRYFDTDLTHKGFNESINLSNIWEDKHNMDLVLVSPLTRTIKTAINIFRDTNVPIIALECLREYPNTLHNCNARKNKSYLQNTFPRVNFNYLDAEVDPTWSINNSESINSLLRRINVLFDFVEKSDCKNIALVGHNSFISMMKDGRLNRHDDCVDSLLRCYPYRLELKYNN